ncbi:unnamed protein product [Clavelina lepadiformis]|uniref:Uncharacterized protein n=1 Tax=Clavelina lepadiformis TaxID=159417 RepID=A0ABP0GTZ1_CLALP
MPFAKTLEDSVLSNGGVIQDNEKVEKINTISPQEVEILTTKATYNAKSIVITCGPWTNNILKAFHIQLPIKTFRINVPYWGVKKPDLFEASKGFPCIIFDYGSADEHIYSIPIMEYSGLMKVSHFCGSRVDPDKRHDFDTVAAKNAAMLTKKHYPNLLSVPETCIKSVMVSSSLPLLG